MSSACGLESSTLYCFLRASKRSLRNLRSCFFFSSLASAVAEATQLPYLEEPEKFSRKLLTMRLSDRRKRRACEGVVCRRGQRDREV